MMKNLNEQSSYLIDLAMGYAPKLAAALLTLIIGWWIVNKLTSLLKGVMKKKEVDPSLQSFLGTLAGITLKIVLLVSVVDMVGVEVTSFVAILGAAGLAIGLALSGTLQNFAGGVMILLFKPYKVGDVIEAEGFIASVAEIQIFNTIMKSWDNKTIIVPNARLANNSLTNYSTEPQRKVEWIFGIGYDDDIDKARSIIEETVFSDERVLDEKGSYYINVSSLGDSAVNIKVRALVESADYWNVFFENTEKVKKAFDAQGINIPYPQRDVHLYNQK